MPGSSRWHRLWFPTASWVLGRGGGCCRLRPGVLGGLVAALWNESLVPRSAGGVWSTSSPLGGAT